MDRMLEMMQTLLSDTAELKERISAVEGALSERLQPSIPARATGIAAQRGGRVTRSKRGALGAILPQPVTVQLPLRKTPTATHPSRLQRMRRQTQIMTSAALTTTV
jgi:hypothetical protein